MNDRDDRLNAELEALRALRKASTILDFEFSGDPPDRYTLEFRGRGVSQVRSDVEFADVHRIELRLPYSFPQKPPDFRWLTPIFHPNISFSGFISLDDIGLPWQDELGLDVICERLWDVARLSYLDLSAATNHCARGWFESSCSLTLPVDVRPMRDRSIATGKNVVRYQRCGERRVPVPGQASDVLFIGEDTPTPAIPVRIVSYRYPSKDDDDVLYIE